VTHCALGRHAGGLFLGADVNCAEHPCGLCSNRGTVTLPYEDGDALEGAACPVCYPWPQGFPGYRSRTVTVPAYGPGELPAVEAHEVAPEMTAREREAAIAKARWVLAQHPDKPATVAKWQAELDRLTAPF
jgi:hypothetical protein